MASRQRYFLGYSVMRSGNWQIKTPYGVWELNPNALQLKFKPVAKERHQTATLQQEREIKAKFQEMQRVVESSLEWPALIRKVKGIEKYEITMPTYRWELKLFAPIHAEKFEGAELSIQPHWNRVDSDEVEQVTGDASREYIHKVLLSFLNRTTQTVESFKKLGVEG